MLPLGKTIRVHESSLPTVYQLGSNIGLHTVPEKVILECINRGNAHHRVRRALLMHDIQHQLFTMDVRDTHVIEAIG
jgi:hypothetical protein